MADHIPQSLNLLKCTFSHAISLHPSHHLTLFIQLCAILLNAVNILRYPVWLNKLFFFITSTYTLSVVGFFFFIAFFLFFMYNVHCLHFRRVLPLCSIVVYCSMCTVITEGHCSSHYLLVHRW